MKPEEFVYYMQGFVEITGTKHPSPKQWAGIVEKLSTVFNKKTPARNVSEKIQQSDFVTGDGGFYSKYLDEPIC